MKTILIFFILLSTSICLKAQISPLNLADAYDNTLQLPRSAEEGFNMFTDNTITVLKPAFLEKINFIVDYSKKVNDYMLQTAQEIQTLSINNDPIIQDTSMEELNRKIKALNLEMEDIVTAGMGELGKAQAEFAEQIKAIQGNQQKLSSLNTYISGKYANIFNSYSTTLREKLTAINNLYQEAGYGTLVRNPVSRVNTLASLYATLQAYVNHRNDIAKGTAERLARDYMAYKN